MRKIPAIIKRAGQMCRPALIVLRISMVITILCLLTSLLLLLHAGDFSIDTYKLYEIAYEIYELPQGLLLFGIIISVCIEDMVTQKG